MGGKRRRDPSPGVSFQDLHNAGWLDPCDLVMLNKAARDMGVQETSQTERDFWLAEHAGRIMNAVGGLAFTATTLPGFTPQERERQRGTIDRAVEISDRLTHYVVQVQPFTLEYYPDMPEAALRAWAAALVSALKGD